MSLISLPGDIIRYFSDVYFTSLDLSCFRRTCRKFRSLVKSKPVPLSLLYTYPSLLQYFCFIQPDVIPFLDRTKGVERGNIHSLWLIHQLTKANPVDTELVLSRDEVLLAAKHNNFDLLRWYYSVKPCKFSPLVLREFIRHNNALAVRWLLLVETYYLADATMTACQYGSLECLRVLVDAGATIYQECSTMALKNSHFHILVYLAQLGKLQHRPDGYAQCLVQTNVRYQKTWHLPPNYFPTADQIRRNEVIANGKTVGYVLDMLAEVHTRTNGDIIPSEKTFTRLLPMIHPEEITITIPENLISLLNARDVSTSTLKSFDEIVLSGKEGYYIDKSKVHTSQNSDISPGSQNFEICQQILNSKIQENKGKVDRIKGRQKLCASIETLEMASLHCQKLSVQQIPSHQYYQYLETYIGCYLRVIHHLMEETEKYYVLYPYGDVQRKLNLKKLYQSNFRLY